MSVNKMRVYNQDILSQAKSNLFASHNIVKEVLNKPIVKKSTLSNAQSLNPYHNPNDHYFAQKR